MNYIALIMRTSFMTLVFVVGFSCISSSNLFSQEKQVKFRKIEGASGILLGKINSIAQDQDGFIWLSDQTLRCIIKYDGSHMQRYAYDPNDPNSLGGFYPESLFIDSAGIIWIGFYGQGVDRFDPTTNTFTHYDHDPDDPGSLVNNIVSVVMKDSKGNLWVGSDGGLSMLDETTGKFTNYIHDPDDPASLSYNIVRSIYEDREGTLWIGTGIGFNSNGLGGLNRFNPEDQTFTRYLNDPEDPASIINNQVRAIYEDSRGKFWVGTGGDGLHTLDKETGKFTRYSYDPNNPSALSRGPMSSSVDHITFITEDADNKLWIGTESNGIIRYDFSTSTKEHFNERNNISLHSGFGDQSGWTAFPTDDGLMWITTQQASLYLADINTYSFPFIEVEKGAISFSDDGMGNLWLATDDGLILADNNGNVKEQYTHNLYDPNSISSNILNHITTDKEGYLWISTTSGINKFNPLTKTFNRYLQPGQNNAVSIPINVHSTHNFGDSILWISTRGEGLFKMNMHTEEFINFRYDPNDLESIPGNFLTSIIQEDKHHLLIGHSRNDGLTRINIKTNKIQRLVPGLAVRHLHKDSQGVIRLSTPNGVYIKNPGDNSFVSMNEFNIDLDIKTSVKSIIEDNNENLWIGTVRGLYRINRERDKLLFYGQESDLFDESPLFLKNPYKGPNGKIYFSARQGYYEFYPERVDQVNDNSTLGYMDFWINGEQINTSQHPGFEDYILNGDKIFLRHNENIFALNFTITDFRSRGNKEIFYKLENYDQDWRVCKPMERINYFNLPSGQYNFKIKAVKSGDGEYIEKHMGIFVAKPWWAQWWAYIIYAFLLIIGVKLVHEYQKKKVLKAEREKVMEKDLLHAKEIEKAYNDLKTTQNQLIQSEKMASLGELTAGIAHEIQNPLNFVNNFSELNRELIDEMKEEIYKGNYQDVEGIANDISENEKKITHHGKRAEGIVKSMLQHSRSSDGKKEPTDINALTDEYLRLAYHGMRAKDKSFNVAMETSFDESLGKISVVPQDLGRVILNLITNAFHAVAQKIKTKEEGYSPLVKVSTRIQPPAPASRGDAQISPFGVPPLGDQGAGQGEERLQISIKDNGSGIPQDIVDKIFQPFFTTKPTGQGTGLGLSMSYDIITKGHGGNLLVKSKEGKYTEFIISLPLDNHKTPS